jgi:hypothetical protein
MAKTVSTRWEVWHYDVVGNEEEGYGVNDRSKLHSEYPLTLTVKIANPGTQNEFSYAYPSDAQIRNAMNLLPRTRIDTDGDGMSIYVNWAKNGYPLGEMHCVSHLNLSPIKRV